MSTKNRIKEHRKIRAGDLVPHELNPRVHTEAQRSALKALYDKIGFARSLLAYELPDGRLKLIDGHLRQSMDPDQEVDVEVLDVNDEEARALLLSIDPLAQLADYDNQALEELRRITETDHQTLGALWASLEAKDKAFKEDLKRSTPSSKENTPPSEQFMVMIECQSEQEQVALLRRFKKEGMKCRALTS